MAQHNHRVAARLNLIRREGSTGLRGNGQHAKKVGGNLLSENAFRLA